MLLGINIYVFSATFNITIIHIQIKFNKIKFNKSNRIWKKRIMLYNIEFKIPRILQMHGVAI